MNVFELYGIIFEGYVVLSRQLSKEGGLHLEETEGHFPVAFL
jgi:hypothetical protein